MGTNKFLSQSSYAQNVLYITTNKSILMKFDMAREEIFSS